MIRPFFLKLPVSVLVSACLALTGCGDRAKAPAPAQRAVRKVKILQFYATDKTIPRGLTGKLCYSVENAKKVQLDPPSEDVWPALTRCFEISPKQTTKYTLTAIGEDGHIDTKSVDVKAGSPPPRIKDLTVSAQEVLPGELVRICFKVENTTRVKAGPGKFAQGVNCLNDVPRKTTTYTMVAYGDDRQEDKATVTVRVR
jgi:hypothetical protein